VEELSTSPIPYIPLYAKMPRTAHVVEERNTSTDTAHTATLTESRLRAYAHRLRAHHPFVVVE
ncbi:hypothetical protein M8818_005147, partial [Zalaria obscura]